MKRQVLQSKWIALILLFCLSANSLQAQDRPKEKHKEKDEKWEEIGKKVGEACEDLSKNLEKTIRETFDDDFKNEMSHLSRDLGYAMRELSEEIADNQSRGDAHSGNLDEERRKKMSRSFKVNGSDVLSITNQFGKVHINTWDKGEINVEVTMIGRANTSERAQEILDLINVLISEENNLIAFKTEIGKTHSNNHNGKKGFEINYTVTMPKNNPLRLKNSFGDVYIANLNGRPELNVSYGSLKAEHLTHSESFVKVSFGSGNIESMKGGTLDVNYSTVNVENMGNLTVSSDFSKLEIEKAGNLDLKARYGSVKLGSATSIVGSAGFSEFEVDRVSEKIDMRVQYCNDFEIQNMTKGFKQVNLDAGYSKIRLNFDPGTSFNFDVSLQYADLDAGENLNNFSFVEKKSNSKIYKGTFGKGSGGWVKIASRYGNVDFNLND